MFPVYVSESTERGANSAALVWAHGGGGVSLSASGENELMIRWAHKYKCIVFNVEYSLAPEWKSPKGPRDFMHTFLHVYENAAKYNVDRTKIVIAGDSGGGFICLEAAYQLIL